MCIRDRRGDTPGTSKKLGGAHQLVTTKPSGFPRDPLDHRPAETEARSSSKVRGEANRRTDK
eukprot:14972073-Alexandrium_andersonii.AAC.1